MITANYLTYSLYTGQSVVTLFRLNPVFYLEPILKLVFLSLP
jgi:hypothetical protein